MRRLMALAVTISLRVTLAIVLGVWVYSQMHTFRASGYRCFVEVNHEGYEAGWRAANPSYKRIKLVWKGSTLGMQSRAYETKDRPEYPFSVSHFGLACTLASFYKAVAVRHQLLFVSLLVANTAHWLWWRRKRKALAGGE